MAKKIISIALVIVMMFSLSVTAFAAADMDKVETVALASATEAFENGDYSESVISALKVSSVVENASDDEYLTSYTVTVTSGLLYTYTCTVDYDASWEEAMGEGEGIYSVDNGSLEIEDDIFTLILNQIYEFFLGIYEQIVAFFDSLVA